MLRLKGWQTEGRSGRLHAPYRVTMQHTSLLLGDGYCGPYCLETHRQQYKDS